ncbi:MAG: L-threonylcarbamoyladenylate synthase [bacterium]|nr:L-threonylcarbamoyladenylate synthase [bacterium]
MNRSIDEAVAALKAGEIIVFPTDTVYGIGCDPFSETALKKLYEVKQRPREKSIPVLVSSIERAHELGHITPACEQLLKKHWPGALTVVVEQKAKFPAAISLDETIALRMPNHPTSLALIEAAGGAIATTSANISGEAPATSFAKAKKIFDGKVAAMIDGGKTLGGIASTMVDCTHSTGSTSSLQADSHPSSQPSPEATASEAETTEGTAHPSSETTEGTARQASDTIKVLREGPIQISQMN